VHAFYFYHDVGPALLKKYQNNTFATVWLALGWLLFFKVTYTYWYVSRSDPGTPKDIRKIKSEQPTFKELSYLAKNYSNDIAELKKYSHVWNENFEVIDGILS